jgi:cysteinyl-tRNA synthetase
MVGACARDDRAAPVVAAPHQTVVEPARPTSTEAPAPSAHLQSVGPGFAEQGPWVTFYGTAAEMGDLAKVSQTYRIIDIDADPGADRKGNFSDAQIALLRGDGRNRVLSYLNLGACERFRTYWRRAPSGMVPCGENRAAMLGTYADYPDETWMDLGNAEYRALLLDFVAPRLAARGIDGFYLDNLEVAEHSAAGAPEGWCSPACRQGALDTVRGLRERFPGMLIVMQNATSDVTRLGSSGDYPFPALLDGVAHEEVYSPAFDAQAETELTAWRSLGLRSKNGDSFFVGVVDYVGGCANMAAARTAYSRSRSHGFSPYASDASGSQKVVCYWPF